MKIVNFLLGLISHNGEPSSKRAVGMAIIIYLMIVMYVRPFNYETFVTWLASGLISLGISTIDKLGEFIKRGKNEGAS